MDIDLENWSCPLPLRDRGEVVLGHGGGGKLSAELIEQVFLPAFDDDALAGLGDSTPVWAAGQRLALTTDGYVVRPLFFPGGCIGDLAVNGTVNDLAMSGSTPLYLTCGFILEEGLPIDVLARIADAMAAAARRAGVRLVAGDTKVVERGRGDGVYITTAGVGLLPPASTISPSSARSGDVVLVSGPIGQHGIAVMSVREGLEFGTEIQSDTAPLNGLVEAMLHVGGAAVHALRDPTRGGVAATVNEIARASAVGVELVERDIPVPEAVAAACGFLGLDPLLVANEGRLVAFVAPDAADAVLAAMQAHEHGTGARVIGRAVDLHPGVVTVRTPLGAVRIVDVPLGEQLPRIC